jgi:uncharacterized protein with NRDE domain
LCSLIILRRPGDAWPVLVGANRDELVARPARPPARHWPDRPEVVAGLDELAHGSWLGINDDRVMAAVLNRVGSLGPVAGKRSRGELVLEALDHAEAKIAAAALRELDPAAYRPFNLLVADPETGFWVGSDGSRITVAPLKDGLTMVTAHDPDDMASARIRRYRPLFAAAAAPDPDRQDWTDWQLLLASPQPAGSDPREAMCIPNENGYGTRSSSLIGLPADPLAMPQWLYADGPPAAVPFKPVQLQPSATGSR